MNELRTALNHLISGQKLDKYDYSFGKSLARQSTWSTAQETALLKMLGKYRTEIDGTGINLGAITPTVKPIQKIGYGNHMKAYWKDDRIFISFKLNYKEFNNVLVVLKTLPGRQYHEAEKAWSVPYSVFSVEKLIELGFTIDDAIMAKHSSSSVPKTHLEMPKGLTLYPFQEIGVQEIERLDGRCLLADEQGLGKTIQAIAYLKMHPELRPAVVVVPASLKLNWKKEFKKWLPNEDVEVVFGKCAALRGEKIVVINYDILMDYLDMFDAMEPKIVIFDEVHYCKSLKAKRTKAARQLAKGIEKIIAISGTPITNRPAEFFSTLNMLSPELFPAEKRFYMEFCGPEKNQFGYAFTGSSNTLKLHEILKKSFMIRRLKKDVLTELPDKVRSIIPIDIVNRRDYEKAEKNFIQWIRENKGDEAAMKAKSAQALVFCETMKQLSVKGKLDYIIEWIENFIESEKLILFCTHHFVIDTIMEYFGDAAVKLDGRDSAANRQSAVDRFQEDENARLFVGNIKAAGAGITLTAASSCAFIELDWVPGNHEQAESRHHRIGQTAESVNAYYLVGVNTIEEDLAEMLDNKSKNLGKILNGEEPDEDSLLMELIKKYKEKAA